MAGRPAVFGASYLTRFQTPLTLSQSSFFEKRGQHESRPDDSRGRSAMAALPKKQGSLERAAETFRSTYRGWMAPWRVFFHGGRDTEGEEGRVAQLHKLR